MNDEKKLTIFNPDVAMKNFEAFKTFADYFAWAKALPVNITNAPQLVMVMQAGFDMWMSTTDALQSLTMVSGKITMYWPKVIERVRSHWRKLKFEEEFERKEFEKDGKKYKKWVWRCKAIFSKWDETREETYDMEDAKTAWLLTKDNWIKYPKLMLRYRAVGNGVKFCCPEVLWGVAMYEEMKDRAKPEVDVIDWDSLLESFWTKEPLKQPETPVAPDADVTTNTLEEQPVEETPVEEKPTMSDEEFNEILESADVPKKQDVVNTEDAIQDVIDDAIADEVISEEDLVPDKNYDVETNTTKAPKTWFVKWTKIFHKLFGEWELQDDEYIGKAVVLFSKDGTIKQVQTAYLKIV